MGGPGRLVDARLVLEVRAYFELVCECLDRVFLGCGPYGVQATLDLGEVVERENIEERLLLLLPPCLLRLELDSLRAHFVEPPDDVPTLQYRFLEHRVVDF